MRTGILLSLGMGASVAWYLTATAPGPVVAIQPTPSVEASASPTQSALPSVTPTPEPTMTPTAEPTQASPTAAPQVGSLSGLTVVSNTPRAVTVRWDPVAGADKYTVLVNSEAIATIPRTTGVVLWNSRRSVRITVIPVGADNTQGQGAFMDVSAPAHVTQPPQTQPGSTGPVPGQPPSPSSVPQPEPAPSTEAPEPPPGGPDDSVAPPPVEPSDDPAG